MGLCCPDCSTLLQFQDGDSVRASSWCGGCKKLIAWANTGGPHLEVLPPKQFSVRTTQGGGLHVTWHTLMGERPPQELPPAFWALIAGLTTVGIAGRVLTVRSGPFILCRRHLEGGDIRQLRIDVRARPFFERDRSDYPSPYFEVVACTRKGERVRVVRKLESSVEAVWLAGALTWALDIAEPPELLSIS